MSFQQEEKCRTIIHSRVVAVATGNAVSIPDLVWRLGSFEEAAKVLAYGLR